MLPNISVMQPMYPVSLTEACEHRLMPKGKNSLQARNVFLLSLFIACAGSGDFSVRFVTGPDNNPTEAILTGVGAQGTFQNTAGQVVVVTNNSPGTVSIPISSNGDPSIPAGSDVSVVSTNPSIPSTPSSSPAGGHGKPSVWCWALDRQTLPLNADPPPRLDTDSLFPAPVHCTVHTSK